VRKALGYAYPKYDITFEKGEVRWQCRHRRKWWQWISRFANSLDVGGRDVGGVTRQSLDAYKRWCGLIGRPVSLFLVYQSDPWEFFTYVVDAKGKALCFDGFAWGYLGEGPRGLETLLFVAYRFVLPSEGNAPSPHAGSLGDHAGRLRSQTTNG